MRRSVRPWLVVVPLATLGVLVGHELAYELTGTPKGELHGYLGHLPQVALLLFLLSLLGASLVERGRRLRLWPFPAVVMVGFVAQEHLERLAHDGSMPVLLDKPFFLVGLALQSIVAIAAWLLARLLARIVGVGRPGTQRGVGDAIDLLHPAHVAPVATALAGARRSRAPPLER